MPQMNITIFHSTCDGGKALLQDLCSFRTADKWLNAILSDKAAWKPKDIRVTLKGYTRDFLIEGYKTPYTESILTDLTGIPAFRREIPCDGLCVRANIPEHRLHFIIPD